MFIAHISAITAVELFICRQQQVKFYTSLKYELMVTPVLILPDMSKPFILQTDVSDSGVCAVLLHVASVVPLYDREGMLRFGAGRPNVSKVFI